MVCMRTRSRLQDLARAFVGGERKQEVPVMNKSVLQLVIAVQLTKGIVIYLPIQRTYS